MGKPFRLDTLLTEEEIAISNSARDYAREKLYPRVIEDSRTENFDRSAMREMGEMGFLGLLLKATVAPELLLLLTV